MYQHYGVLVKNYNKNITVIAMGVTCCVPPNGIFLGSAEDCWVILPQGVYGRKRGNYNADEKDWDIGDTIGN